MTEPQWRKLRKHLLKEAENGVKYIVFDEILREKMKLPDDFLIDLKARLAKDAEIGVKVGYDLTFDRKV